MAMAPSVLLLYLRVPIWQATHQIVWQAARSAHVRRDGRVAHVARQRDQADHAAKADGDPEQARGLHDDLGHLHITCDCGC